MVWNWYSPGKGGGPLDVKCPAELGGNTKSGKGGNRTQAVALKLLERLPKARYHLWMDNLFTSNRFLELLADRGYGGTGTCRTSSGVLKELITMKNTDKDDHILWGTIKSLPIANGNVCHTAWKDNAIVLMMSNVHDGKDLIKSLRKRPKETSSKAKTARKPFGNLAEKILEIPVLFHKYNFNMGAVDEYNNIASRNAGLQPIRHGGYQALDHWLLRVVLINSYLLSLLGGEEDTKREVDFRSQKDFRQQIATALLHRGQRGPLTNKRRISIISIASESLPPKDHELVKRQGRKQCVCCAGMRIGDRPPKRVALGQIAANSNRPSCRTDTYWYCKQCDVAICKKNDCWNRFHCI